MKKSRADLGIAGFFISWCAWMLLSGTSSLPCPSRRKPRRTGFPPNCQYCHVEKLPKKDAMTHNDRGKWLVAEKAKRNAKEVDPAWLKEYPGDKK